MDSAKGSNGNGRQREAGGNDEEANSLESHVVTLAKQGRFSDAGHRAIESQLKRGLAVVFKRGNQIIKLRPNGDEEILETLEPATYSIPPGVAILSER